MLVPSRMVQRARWPRGRRDTVQAPERAHGWMMARRAWISLATWNALPSISPQCTSVSLPTHEASVFLQHDDKMLHIPCSTRDKFNVVVTCMLLPTLAKIFCWQARCVLWRMAVTRAWYA